MLAVLCKPDNTDKELRDMEKASKLFQLCQTLVQRYRMHGCPTSHRAFQDFSSDMDQTAKRRGLGAWAKEKTAWCKLVRHGSADGLDNLLELLECDRWEAVLVLFQLCLVAFLDSACCFPMILLVVFQLGL